MNRPTSPLSYFVMLFALLLTGMATSVRAHESGHHGAKHTAAKAANQSASQAAATRLPGEVTYLGNEGLMVKSGNHKILFDPFFHNDYDSLQLVPPAIVQAIMSGQKPYDGIDAIFISHAHEDHFSARDVKQFLRTYAKAKLIAPRQAVEELASLPDMAQLMSQVIAVDLKLGDAPWQLKLGDLQIEAVRIAHAGWPQRAEVENLVYRVSIGNKLTVMHLGDADPNAVHFSPFAAHWKKQLTDTAFPPYWFFLSAEGNQILDHQINATESIGVHVPVEVPPELRASGKRYFSKPGEQRAIGGGSPDSKPKGN